MTQPDIAVVGWGLLGRLLAWRATKAGLCVALYDAAGPTVVPLDAPNVELRHMLRLLHPRYSIYVVPRAQGKLVVDATSIESNDRSPVSVRGALELLTTAYFMLPLLAEAHPGFCNAGQLFICARNSYAGQSAKRKSA